MLSERALAASADAWLAALPPATGWLLALGLGHVAGLGVLWRAIAAGVPMRIADGSDPQPRWPRAIASPEAEPRVARPDAARAACSTPPVTRRRRPTSARCCSAAGSSRRRW